MAMQARPLTAASRPMPTRLAFYRLLPLAGALAVLALVAGPLTRPIAPPADSSPAPTAPPAVALQALWAPQPLAFEANHGQADAGIDFVARGRGYTLALAAGEAVFALRAPAATSSPLPLGVGGGKDVLSDAAAGKSAPW